PTNGNTASRKNERPWLEAGSDYALLALESASVTDDLQLPLQLSPGTWTLPDSPVPYDLFLRRKLGEFPEAKLSNSNVVLFLSTLARNVPDLEHRVRELWAGLLLQGCPNFKGGQMLLGSVLDGRRVTINSVQDQHSHYPYFFGVPQPVSPRNLERATTLARGIRHLFDPNRGNDFRRLRRGFLAWYAGVLEEEPEPRLHQFVRSLEGITRASGREDHVRRGQLFTGTSQGSQDLL